MKIFIYLLLVVSLQACVIHLPSIPQKAPKDASKVSTDITVEYDKFNNTTSIRTPLYLSRKGFTDTFPVQLRFRSTYQNDARLFIQLYVVVSDVDWGFYHSANGEDGYSFDFIDIDSKASVELNMVNTKEVFGVSVPIEYLRKIAGKDWEVKAYGKRKEGTFIIPGSLSAAFLKELECFEEKNC
ncbi:hypothetical protein ACOI22_03860 [Glaciecola sp. 2405UD65-10]|uniref:hypothetical protein n=1 Tax=Glaciecola sp. 2405UD65-10 TaxID=3397244 RepID=UPI003B5C2B2A